MYLETKSQFEDAIKINKTIPRFPSAANGEKSITEKLNDVFDNFQEIEVDSNIISRLRLEKKTTLELQWTDPVRIFLPKMWTLEYELASSILYRYLALSVELARLEKGDIHFEINKEVLDESLERIENKYLNTVPTPQESYEVFRPLDDGIISKAATAQYLAYILEDQKKQVKDKIKNDPTLKYLIDAITYVTKPLDDEVCNA